MKIGIIGLPQSGKSAVFAAACGKSETPASATRLQRAIIQVPDERLNVLSDLAESKRIVNAEIELLDAGGFSGSVKGAGVDSKALAELKQMDALLLTVDSFSGTREADSDIQNAIDEMILNDLAQIESQVPKLEKVVKMGGAAERAEELKVLKKCLVTLEEERPLIELSLNDAELKEIRGYTFLSIKPLLIVINIAEDKLTDTATIESTFDSRVTPHRCEVAVICGKIEMELAEMEADERAEFLQDLGILHPAVDVVIQKAYTLLGLIPYFTAGEMESRAWTIRRGCIAQKAAGVIHTDIERGFIRAEVIAYDDYVSCKTPAEAKKQGKMRLEGKEYVVQDGDVINYRFNV
jgi:ribosome-binding ATPase